MNETVSFTKREKEIAELFAWGAAKKDVAKILFISERTVENHARTIHVQQQQECVVFHGGNQNQTPLILN